MTLVNSDNYEKEVLKSKLPVVVDFFAAWCGPCRYAMPTFVKMAERYHTEVKFAAFNVDRSKDLRAEYQLQGVPTFFFMSEGKIVDRNLGGIPEKEFSERIQKLINLSK